MPECPPDGQSDLGNREQRSPGKGWKETNICQVPNMRQALDNCHLVEPSPAILGGRLCSSSGREVPGPRSPHLAKSRPGTQPQAPQTWFCASPTAANRDAGSFCLAQGPSEPVAPSTEGRQGEAAPGPQAALPRGSGASRKGLELEARPPGCWQAAGYTKGTGSAVRPTWPEFSLDCSLAVRLGRDLPFLHFSFLG